jgi:hypothetical protein
MTKLLIKFLTISGILLASHQTFGTEKEKEKGVPTKPSRQAPASKPRKSALDDLDGALDKIDEEVKEKKQSYPNRFTASQSKIFLGAPLKTQDAQSARWIKTLRKQIPGTLCWVSMIVNDYTEYEALKEAVHPLLAEFIKGGGAYDSQAAQDIHKKVQEELKDATTEFTVASGIILEFQDLIAIEQETAETAALLRSKGQKSATSDRAIYKVMHEGKPMMMRMRDKWIPATVRLNITYNPPKSEASPIRLAEGLHQGANTAVRYLEMPKGPVVPQNLQRKNRTPEKS